MGVSISHPTDRPNFAIVEVGSLELAFSYRTIVAFRDGWGAWTVRENEWGPTTGKHLNYIDGGERGNKANRLSGEEFGRRLNEIMARLVPAEEPVTL